MKRKQLIYAIIASFLLALISSCSSKSSSQAVKPMNKTLYIYMCGSNLETKKGLAGKNIDEILSADISDDMNIVIETGGTLQWQSHGIDSSALSRYEVLDGQLELVETLEQANMGEAETLTDFLTWGQKYYPSEHNMLIFWDHGAGPTGGVCFDENYDYDSLTLSELSSALKNAGISKKFDIIGFDACLMASIESAAIVKDYADYMIASEEIEPSGGWDYKALTEAFSSDRESLETGRIVCDSYIEKCKLNGKELLSTLSVFDLSYTDEMLNQFELTIHSFIEGNTGSSNFSSVLSAMRKSEKFGGSNSYQGASNLIDLLNFVANILNYESINATEVFIVAKQFVPYTVNAGTRKTRGVSFFYPLVYDREAITDYVSVGISEEYNAFLTKYYLDAPDTTIEYNDKGSTDDDGSFTVSPSPESISYISSVDYILSQTDDAGIQHIICTDNDIDKDWENLVFKSKFNGISLGLEGHRLFYTSQSENDEYANYTSPVIVNGKRTNLQFSLIMYHDLVGGAPYRIQGTWDGYDENGLPDNDIIPLKKGDRIQVVTDVTLENGMPKEHYSEEFTIGENGGEISELPLEENDYQYTYVMTDIFGYTFVSDMATFKVTADSEGRPSVKIINVEPSTLEGTMIY